MPLMRAPRTERDGAVNIVVLQADERQFGLVVDQINDTEEIVVKPLRKQLKTVKIFAGSSIMGDGKVALILDVLGLAQYASVVTETRDRALAEKTTGATAAAAGKQTFLLFAGPGDSRMAIPLSTLARLEEFPVAQVEMSGSQWVTQYRGQILPLIRLDVALHNQDSDQNSPIRALQAPPSRDSGPIQVLVLNHDGRSFGLVVERILDIVEDRADVRSAANRAAVLYSVVIGNRVTELLDIPAILRSADLEPYPARHRNEFSGGCELDHGSNSTVLHILSGQAAVRRGIERRPGSHPLARYDQGPAGASSGERPDQPARANRYCGRSAAASRTGAQPSRHACP